MKLRIKATKAIEILLDEVEAIKLISVLENHENEDFRKSLIWQLNVMLNNIQGEKI